MNYAVVGMASIVGGVTGAAMTAIVMVFEMTRDYVIIIPLIIAVAISIGVRRGLLNETIYTIKLARQGQAFLKRASPEYVPVASCGGFHGGVLCASAAGYAGG